MNWQKGQVFILSHKEFILQNIAARKFKLS